MRVVSLFALLAVLTVGCVDPSVQGTDGRVDAGTKDPLQSAANAVAKSPALFVCREACWSDIPYNACGDQRDACLSKAGTDVHAAKQCRHMSRTCRHERRACLRSCNKPGNVPALHKPAAPAQQHEPGQAAEDTDADGAEPAE